MRAEEIQRRKRRILLDALRKARGDRRRAAQTLGFSPRALAKLLKSLEVDVPRRG